MRNGFFQIGPLLQNIGPVIIPENQNAFSVKEKFVVNKHPNAPVRIGRIGANIEEWFFDRIEESNDKIVLYESKLRRKAANDNIIIAMLGGFNKVQISWFAIWHLMGAGMLNRHSHNIFYVEDNLRFYGDDNIAFINKQGERRVLRWVKVSWENDGWDHWGWRLMAGPLMFLGRIAKNEIFFTPTSPIC